jgi:N terminal of Calcineurin-like phosphoesterase
MRFDAMMRAVDRRRFIQMSVGMGAMVWLPRLSERPYAAEKMARGTVFHNRDGSGRPGPGNPGIANVAVSNGEQVVVSDAQGRWELPIDDQTDVLFVIKPRGWMVSLNEHQLPQHSYRHSPEGSPKLRFGGLSATGELPASIDFGLTPQDEPDSFRAVICGDPQPRDMREIDYIARTVVPRICREPGRHHVR